MIWLLLVIMLIVVISLVSSSKKKTNLEIEKLKAEIPKQDSPVGLADELQKLSKLRDDGILTEEEFIEQKAKVLSRQ